MEGKRGERNFWLTAIALLAIVFGILTIKSGGEVVFGAAGARAEAGNFVPFVVWFNFLAGFVYIAAGAGLWLRRRWGALLAVALAASAALLFAAFGVHVAGGGAYEMRTVGALALRFAVWSAIALFAMRAIGQSQRPA